MNILVVEDNAFVARIVKLKLEQGLKTLVTVAASLEQTRMLLEKKDRTYHFAILDLNLPDAPQGEVVDYLSAHDIPMVVMTGSFDKELRRKLFSKNIADYVVKGDDFELDYLVNFIKRFQTNGNTKILVVDDSSMTRKMLHKLLSRQNYQIIGAANGQEALAQLEENPDTKLLLTDYNMPEMDGFALIKAVRKRYGPDRIGIIGLSSSKEDALTARFIKCGADDFLMKPFEVEELFCRINQSIANLSLIEQIRDAALKDFLTDLPNRRFFFEKGAKVFDRIKHANYPFAIAMVDIDHFKKINDTYGHDGGDAALIAVADILKNHFRPNDIIARFGGEEFCIFIDQIEKSVAILKLETLRETIEQTAVKFEQHNISMTISIGATFEPGKNLDQTITQADQRLYLAKTSGRNRLIIEGS